MVPTLVMSPEFIAVVAGALLSLFFSYFPKVNTWYAALESGNKQLIMLGLLFLTVCSIFGMACAGFVNIDGFVCERATAIQFVWLFIYAVLSNQGVFKLTPRTQSVIDAKS